MPRPRVPANGSTLRVSAFALLFIHWMTMGDAFAQVMTYEAVDTGQTKCYDADAETMAPSLGQSFYGQDAQFAGIQPSYTLSSDGKTVLDNVTDLTWMRGPNTTLAPPVKSDKKTFSEAQAWVATVNAINYGGFSDWRLPSIKELYSLMNFKGTDLSGSFDGNPTGAEVVFQGANGGGHTWPGSADMSLAFPVGATSQDINATQVTWDFLKTQARRH